MVWVGTGETRLCSLVSEDRPDKPMVKPSGAQRESDGVVVPPIAVRNAAGGKGPDFGHIGDGGEREGMAGSVRSNHPRGCEVPVKVRQLQNRLWAAAKQSDQRVAVSTPCMTASTGVTSSGRRGGGCEPIVVPRGSMV